MNLDTCIVNAATNAWDESYVAGVRNQNNCSGFLHEVARHLQVPLPSGNADSIMSRLPQATGWSQLSNGADAERKAAQGFFVVAGMKGKDHKVPRNNGHVALVISGPLYLNKYPRCWAGSLGSPSGQSQGQKSVGQVWRPVDRDNVQYFAYESASCLPKR